MASFIRNVNHTVLDRDLGAQYRGHQIQETQEDPSATWCDRRCVPGIPVCRTLFLERHGADPEPSGFSLEIM